MNIPKKGKLHRFSSWLHLNKQKNLITLPVWILFLIMFIWYGHFYTCFYLIDPKSWPIRSGIQG